MDDPIMDAFLSWGTGELTEFPDFFDFELYYSTPLTVSSYAPSPIFPPEEPVPSMDGQSHSNSDLQPAAQDAVTIGGAISSLLGRLTVLEIQ